MFDEFVEGTNIAPYATDSSMVPTNQYFLTTSADGKFLSSDFYLRLAGAATRMINGRDPLRDTIPIPPTTGAVAFRTGFEPGMDPQPTSGHKGQSALSVTAGQVSTFEVDIPVTVSTTLAFTRVGNAAVELITTDGATFRDIPPGTRVGSELQGKTISRIVITGHGGTVDNIEISH